MTGRPVQLSRRGLLRLLRGVAGLAAGMSAFSASGQDAAARSAGREASPDQTERAIRALKAAQSYAQLAQELRVDGFDLLDVTPQPVLIDTAGMFVTLSAKVNSDERAAFIAGLVAPATLQVLTIFATIFERRGDALGQLSILRIQASGAVTRDSRPVSISRSCPPNQICPDVVDPGGGGCVGCCSGWYQVSYARCYGFTQYNCVALQRRCCCCNNAATCWYEETGENCAFYCTAGCNPGDCRVNVCGGCA